MANSARGPRSLGELLSAVAGARVDPLATSIPVTGITADVREVERGSLFVAVAGMRADGHAFVMEAVRRGAAAVAVERDFECRLGAPVIRVPNTRHALADLAAAWYGQPGDHLFLIGITGTVAKTSVLSMLEAILAAAGRRLATIGSLGARVDGGKQEMRHTTPDPLVLHEKLAQAVDAGLELAAMEVTSHALVQQRVHGLRYGFGVFTNLLPLEHEDYHGSFRSYAEAKARFFDHLRPNAHLVYSSDDRAVQGLVADRHVTPVGCGRRRGTAVQARQLDMGIDGTRLWLSVRQPLRRVDGTIVPPFSFALSLQIVGSHNQSNAALAAVAALCLGIEPAIIQDALASLPPARRRMEVIHRARFTVIDDTVGHPESVSALFRTVRCIDYGRLHAVVAIRGGRGPLVNYRLAESLVIWGRRFPLSTLVVARSVGSVDDRNRVSDEERDAFVAALRRGGQRFERCDRLEDAVTAVLNRAGAGDLVLLLGAQGMDDGAAVARSWIAAHERT